MAYVPLIRLDQCRKNGGTFVAFEGRELAVFRSGEPEQVAVTDNSCPHAGGNLSGGTLDGSVVTCPWHQWRFDVIKGTCVHSPSVCVRTYPIRIREGTIWIDLAGVDGNNVSVGSGAGL